MNVQKYTHKQTGQILAHNERTEISAKFRRFANESIDKDKTHLNYSLLSEKRGSHYLNERLQEVYKINRSDLVTSIGIVVTLPKEFKGSEGEQRKFFEHCKNYFDDYFGEKNCIAANVHLDEKTPHLHIMYVPIVKNDKYKVKGASKDYEYRLNAAKKVNLNYLKGLHQKMEHYLREKMPEHAQEIKLLTGELQDRDNLPIDILKSKTARQEMERQTVAAESRRAVAQRAAEQAQQRAQQERKASERAHAERLAEEEKLQTAREITKHIQLESKSTDYTADKKIFRKRGLLSRLLTKKDIDTDYIKATEYDKSISERNNAVIANNSYKYENQSLQRQNYRLQERYRELVQERNREKEDREYYQGIVKAIPNALRDVLKKHMGAKEIEDIIQHKLEPAIKEEQARKRQQEHQKQPRKRENHQFNSPSR